MFRQKKNILLPLHNEAKINNPYTINKKVSKASSRFKLLICAILILALRHMAMMWILNVPEEDQKDTMVHDSTMSQVTKNAKRTTMVPKTPQPQPKQRPPFPPHTYEILPVDPEVEKVVVDWSALPILVLNGRTTYLDVFANALTKHGLNYTLVHPDPSKPKAFNRTEWMKSVTKGHAKILREAFDTPTINDVLVLEDDVLLVNFTRFEYAVKYYLYHDRSFYSLQNNDDTSTRYHYGATSYLMNRRFYDEMKDTCLINYSRPIDDCFLSLNRLTKVQQNIFQHGLVESTKVTKDAKRTTMVV